MFDKLLEWDRDFFLYLNGLGNESHDTFWSIITEFAFLGTTFFMYHPSIVRYEYTRTSFSNVTYLYGNAYGLDRRNIHHQRLCSSITTQ